MADQSRVTRHKKISPLSVAGLQVRSYGSEVSLLKEIEGQKAFRSFLISYDSDGLRVYARMNVPSAKVPSQGFPTVIFAHGFSPNPCESGYFQRPYYEAWINSYAENGFVVIMPGYRGHGVVDDQTADGKEYLEKYASLCLTSPFYAIDVLNLVAGLGTIAHLGWQDLGVCHSSQPLVDCKNLFLAAHSMGGDVALLLLVVNHRFNAASIWAGVCADAKNVAAFYVNSELNESKSSKPFDIAFGQEWERITSTVRAEPFFLEDMNDINGFYYLHQLNTPIILHQGTDDHAVLPDWSVELHRKLLELGRLSILHLYQGNDHELSLNDERSIAVRRDVEFFQNHYRTE